MYVYKCAELRPALLVRMTWGRRAEGMLETEPSQIKEVWRVRKYIILTSISAQLIGGADPKAG
jgi:hypothetical protein